MVGIFRPRPRPRRPVRWVRTAPGATPPAARVLAPRRVPARLYRRAWPPPPRVRWPPINRLPDAGEALSGGTRVIDPATLAAYQGATVTRATLVSLDFSGGMVRVNDLVLDLPFDADGDTVAETFIGVGDLGSNSRISESAELRSNSIALTLTGVKSSFRALVLGQQYRGRPCKVWEAVIDPETFAIVGAPTLLFSGRMDTCKMRFGASVGEITVTATDRLADWDRPRTRRRTDADQQARYPGDRFFEFVDEVRAKEVVWGG